MYNKKYEVKWSPKWDKKNLTNDKNDKAGIFWKKTN